jgi:SPASM domain peptide maturase of grasp-with-spasm system
VGELGQNKYFLLYSNCIIIIGWVNSIIYDLHLQSRKYIPMPLQEIIKQAKEKNIKDLLGLYEKKYHKLILQYYKELEKEGFGFYTDDPSQLPDLDLTWDHPSIISNAIIDWTNVSTFKTKKVNELIETLGCEAVQIIIPPDIEKTETILKRFDERRVKSIELLADYVSKSHSKKLIALAEKYLRVFFIYFYNSPEYKEVEGKHNVRITFIDTPVMASEAYTIKSDRWPFVINIPFFTESQKHHTYFNRKIYISATGDIKNAPECEEVIGNINTNNTEELIEVIKKESNQKYWYVSKDKCDVCKHCEFRYMCMDNRIPYHRRDGDWYHKVECNYNPYIGKWSNEEGYKNLKECGIISDENWFFIDYHKVEEINKEIWQNPKNLTAAI